MKERSDKIIIESHWKKIIFVGVAIIIFVAITEFVGDYISRYLNKTSLYIAGLILLVIIILMIIIILVKQRKNNNQEKISKKEISEKELRSFMKIIDNLLDKLPEKEIKKFSKSKNSEIYKMVMKKYGI